MRNDYEQWKTLVEMLEALSLIAADEFDLEAMLDTRGDIEETVDVRELDERFRTALWPALRAAHLESAYRRWGEQADPDEWWLHVEEQ